MSSSFNHPATARAFQEKPWNSMTKHELQQGLIQAFIDDPEITSNANISAVVEEENMKGPQRIKLLGTVDSEKEIERAKTLAQLNTRNEVEITNELTVK